MKPFLAVSILALGIAFYINLSSAYSDRAALGARLMRSIKPTADKKSNDNKNAEDTLTQDMKKQMKRIDALEDIFIGSSGSPGAKKRTKGESSKKSWVDDTQALDNDLMKDEDIYRKRRDASEVGKQEGSKKKSKDNSKENDDSSLQEELERDSSGSTGFSDNTDLVNPNSKKSEIPEKPKDSENKAISDPDGDLMGGTGGIEGDLESDKNEVKDSEDSEAKDDNDDKNSDSEGDDKNSENDEKRSKDDDKSSEKDDQNSKNDNKNSKNEDKSSKSDDEDSKNEENSSKDDDEGAKKDETKSKDEDEDSKKDQTKSKDDDEDSKEEETKSKNDDEDSNAEDDKKSSEKEDKGSDESEESSDSDEKSEADDKSSDDKSSDDSEKRAYAEKYANYYDQRDKQNAGDNGWDKKSKIPIHLPDNNFDDEKKPPFADHENFVSEESFKKPEESEDEKKSDFEKTSEIDKNSEKKSSDDFYFSDDKASGKDDKEEDDDDSKEETAAKKVGCRTVCAAPMDYETCAVPRCDYKVGSIKDLCQYLCHHQKERCEEVCE